MSKKTYISYSKVNTFKACPQKYYLTKAYPPDMNASALPFGKAVESGVDVLLDGGSMEEAFKVFETEWHTASATRWSGPQPVWDNLEIFYYANDYDDKLIKEEDEAKVEDWFASLESKYKKKTWKEQMDKFMAQIKENSNIVDEERKFAHRVLWLCCLNRGRLMLEAFERDLLPHVEKVVAKQKDIKIDNEDGDKLVGIIDYIFKLTDFDEDVLIDLKTAGKHYSNHDLNTSDQLASYAAAEKINKIGYMILLKMIKHSKSCNKCGNEPSSNRKKNCEKCKDGKYTKISSRAETQFITRNLREGEGEEILEDFSDVLVAIKNEVNWKNPASCHNFGRKCEYYDFCWKGKDLDEIPGIKKKGKK